MSAWTVATIAEVEEGEREILRRMDERLERLDQRIADGAGYLVEIRSEVEVTRISYEHQLAQTRRALERFFHAADRLDRTVHRNNEVLDALIRTLTDGGNGAEAE